MAADAAVLAILRHPGAFALDVLRAFRRNQGLLLAGAVAYYTLLPRSGATPTWSCPRWARRSSARSTPSSTPGR
jgi:hypothetical protein